VAPFLAGDKLLNSDLFLASCQLLLTSIRHHPSMQDLLLYPTCLQPPTPSPESKPSQARHLPEEKSNTDAQPVSGNFSSRCVSGVGWFVGGRRSPDGDIGNLSQHCTNVVVLCMIRLGAIGQR